MKNKMKLLIGGLLLVFIYITIYSGVAFGFLCSENLACLLLGGIMGIFMAPGFFVANDVLGFKNNITILTVIGIYLFLMGMLLTWLFLKIKRKLWGKS